MTDIVGQVSATRVYPGESEPGERDNTFHSNHLAHTVRNGHVNNGDEDLATGRFTRNGHTQTARAARFIANPAGNTTTVNASGTTVTASDGLFADQWYLNVINVLPVWRDAYGEGYSGKGVKIAQFEPGMPFSAGKGVIPNSWRLAA